MAGVLLPLLLAVFCASAAFAEPIRGIYVDVAGINWAAQPPTPIVNAGPTNYSHIFCSFFLPSLNLSTDFLSVITNPDPAYGGKTFVDAMHKAGKKVMLVVGGATELPTDPSYFTKNDPTSLAQQLAAIVKAANIHGVDIDWEDDYSNGNPGLTGYGDWNTRKAGSGPAIAWLVTLTKTLRKLLPSKNGYVVSHAPQAPYFSLGYAEVYKQAGDDIDFFNVQFYNQGPDTYSTYKTLVIKESISVPKSCVPVWDGSLTDIITNHGVPQEKVVLGKIIAEGDGNNGYIPVDELSAIVQQARTLFPKLGGVMGWQWGSDTSGAWIAKLSQSL